ncbi:hypothetical protein SAMN04488003_101136 [Loktanella fryxellensis]|uniref:Anti-sigma factor n=1 Tax=Loktanella fryxellensis TaxID=245187 RepID=A0A1H7YGF8_9RHOB|nr:hypothetical protein [Loktanella fryxellensis]SEM44407.1 hypothetical protein SAMN04488003_101136 [Loktanella fryxellensis]
MLAAEYALGLMDQDERGDFERLLHRDADLRAELAFWQDEFSALVPGRGVPVPPHVLDQVRVTLFDEDRTGWLDALFAPRNRPLLIGVATAKVLLVAALIWLLFAG